MKKLFSAFASVLIIFTAAAGVFPVYAAEESDGFLTAPKLDSGNYAAVLNVETGQLLFENKASEATPPTASAKLAAMMVVMDIFLEHGLDYKTQMVEVTAQSQKNIGDFGDISAPVLQIAAGSEYLAEDLIKASLIANANDTCNALAYFCADNYLDGGYPEFIERMNGKAALAGAENTAYKNAMGLEAEGAHTTARDTARITAAFYKYNELYEMACQPNFKFNNGRNIPSKNYLVSESLLSGYRIKEAKGLIAGQRRASGGYTLITTAQKNELTYVFVIMNATGEQRDQDGNRWFNEGNAYDDIKILIPWATSAFKYHTLPEKVTLVRTLRVNLGKEVDTVSVTVKEQLELLLFQNIDMGSIEEVVEFDDKLVYDGEHNGAVVQMIDAPVSKGAVVGKLYYKYNGEIIGTVDLIISSTVDSSGLIALKDSVQKFLFEGPMLKIIIGVLAVIGVWILLSVTLFIIKTVKKIKKMKAKKSGKKRGRNIPDDFR